MITKNKDNNAVDNPNFIGSWNIDKNICKKIIEFYEKNDELHTEGETAGGVDLNKKNLLT